MVSEKNISLSFSSYKSMEAYNPQGMTNLDPRAMLPRIYVGDHQTLLHTKSVSSWPKDFREGNFLRFFSYTVLYKQMTSCDVASLDPRG